MLNLFLLDCAQVASAVRIQRTLQLQEAMDEGSTERALMALAWGANPHAASPTGELLMGRALERHHPRLAAAFLVVGGQFQLMRPEVRGPFWIRATQGAARSRVYDPLDRAASGVLATFSDFQAIAWRMRASHLHTKENHPTCHMRLNLDDPNVRWHALLGILDLVRKEIYVPGSGFGAQGLSVPTVQPSWDADAALVPVLSGVQ